MLFTSESIVNTCLFLADINECERNVCPHECTNTDGAFQCKCYDGYELKDKTTCIGKFVLT